MTKILALDSSSDACSVALNCDGVVTGLFEMAAKSHTQRILPMVDEVLRQAGCDKRELDAIAFGRGPGSFTGLRICLGVVQGLAFGLQVPVVPVSTLAAMAAGYYQRLNERPSHDEKAREHPVLVALDARMSEVYWGLFLHEPHSLLPKPLAPEFVMPPAGVIEYAIATQYRGQMIGLGPGWHYEDLAQLAPAALDLLVYPDAADMARMAEELLQRGEVVSAMEAQPVYLRDEVSWQKRQRIRSE